jgi:hypothetical protein
MSLSCPWEQLKLFLLQGTIMPLGEKELKLSRRATMCLGEQGLKLLGANSHVPWRTNVSEKLLRMSFD